MVVIDMSKLESCYKDYGLRVTYIDNNNIIGVVDCIAIRNGRAQVYSTQGAEILLKLYDAGIARLEV